MYLLAGCRAGDRTNGCVLSTALHELFTTSKDDTPTDCKEREGQMGPITSHSGRPHRIMRSFNSVGKCPLLFLASSSRNQSFPSPQTQHTSSNGEEILILSSTHSCCFHKDRANLLKLDYVSPMIR